MKLTVRDLSGLLGVTERQIYRWIDERQIPGRAIAGQHRFHREEILEWAAQRDLALGSGPAAGAGPGTDTARLAQALRAGGVHRLPGGEDRAGFLSAVLERLPVPAGFDREVLRRVLDARERLGAVVRADGIATPGLCAPVVLAIEAPWAALFSCATPWPAAEPGGPAIRALLLLVTDRPATHEELCAELSAALLCAPVREALLRPASAEELAASVEREGVASLDRADR